MLHVQPDMSCSIVNKTDNAELEALSSSSLGASKTAQSSRVESPRVEQACNFYPPAGGGGGGGGGGSAGDFSTPSQPPAFYVNSPVYAPPSYHYMNSTETNRFFATSAPINVYTAVAAATAAVEPTGGAKLIYSASPNTCAAPNGAAYDFAYAATNAASSSSLMSQTNAKIPPTNSHSNSSSSSSSCSPSSSSSSSSSSCSSSFALGTPYQSNSVLFSSCASLLF